MDVNTDWFRARLADRRLSQRALARAMGLDAAAVSLMLRGRREMKLAEAADPALMLPERWTSAAQVLRFF